MNSFVCCYVPNFAQYFFLINLNLELQFGASFSLLLILLASAPHLAGVRGVDQVVGVIVRAALSVTHRGLPGPRGGGPHMTGQKILISPQQLWVAGELASSLARASSSRILLKVTEILKHPRICLRLCAAVMDRLVVMGDGSE